MRDTLGGLGRNCEGDAASAAVTYRRLKQVTPAQNLEFTLPWTLQRFTNHRQELAKVRQSCRPSSKDNHGDLQFRDILLIRQILVDGQEYVELTCRKSE